MPPLVQISIQLIIEQIYQILADENCELNQTDSPTSPQTSIPNRNLSRTPVREQMAKRKRKSDSDDILARLTTNSEMISKVLCENPDPNEKFLNYLGESLKAVDSSKRRKCEKDLLHLVDCYVDGISVEIVNTEQIFQLDSQ